VTQHFVAGVDSEFDEYGPLRDAKHLGADIDDAATEFQALIERTTRQISTTDHRDGLKAHSRARGTS
jgi:hypothetical protein